MKQKSTERLGKEIRQLKRDIIFLKKDKAQLTKELMREKTKTKE